MKKIETRKLILLIISFEIEFSLTIASNQFFRNNWIFINHGLFFRGNYTLQL